MIDSCRHIVLLVCSVLLLMPLDTIHAKAEVGPPFKFTFIPTFIPEGQVGCVDVVVEGIEDVISFEFPIAFDETIFSFSTINSTFIDAGLLDASVSPTFPNVVTVILFSPFGTVTIPDGEIGFTLCFEALGNDGDVSQLVFSETLPNGNEAQIFSNAGAFQAPDLCVVGNSVTIGDPPMPLELITMEQASTCQNSEDGVLELEITGGLEPYSLLVTDCSTGAIIRGPEDVGPIVVVDNLNPADYCIEITDSNIPSMVLDTMATIINNGPSLGASFNIMEPNCNGESNGSIEAIAILNAVSQPNPTTDFSFIWTQNGGTGTTVGPVLDNIGAGTYEVQVTDVASGCSVTLTTFLTEPASVVVDLAVTDVTCMTTAFMDGSLAAVTSGGVGGYTFLYDDLNSSTDSLVTGLPIGTYTVVVLDANGCAGTDTDQVSMPTPPQITGIDSVSITCPSAMDGELEVLFTDGSAMVDRVEWVIPGGAVETGPRITNLGPGEYLATVTGLDNCASSIVVTLGPSDGVMIDVAGTTVTDEECSDDQGTLGSIVVALSGGTAPFMYFLNDELQPGGIFSNLTAGDYDVFVEDVSGCVSTTVTFTVNRPLALDVDFIDIVPALCFEGPGAGATVVPINGQTTSTFEWQSGETNATATSLMGGEQTLLLRSGNCTLDTFVVIPQPTEIMIDPMITQITCFGESDGRIELNPAGGTGVITATSSVPVNGTILENLPADLYTVIVTDENNCERAFSFEISEPPSLDAFISDVQDISCNGDGNGILEVGFMGGTGNPTFLWSTGADDIFSTNTGLLAGVYEVTVTDENGCEAVATGAINEPSPIVAVIPPIPDAICFNEQTVINVTQATGGNGAPYTYTVNAGPRIPINSQIPVFAGDYTITVFDDLGCRTAIDASASEPPPVQVNAGGDQEINLGGETLIFASANSSVAIDSIVWIESPGDSTLSCNDCLNPTASPLDDTSYELFVVDVNGCSNSDVIFISVDSDRNVFIPNTFSPYVVDGINDFFSPFTGIGVEQVISFDIYDRWGEQVFAKEPFLPGRSETEGWDGTFRGQIASKGVYFYIINVRFIDGVVLTFRGDVTIL